MAIQASCVRILYEVVFHEAFILRFAMAKQKASKKMSRLMTKQTKWHVRPAKTLISLGICPVWSESSLCTQWVAKDPGFLHADSKDSDQTGRMPRLIWVFAGRTCHFVGFVTRRLKWDCILYVLEYFLFTLVRTLSGAEDPTCQLWLKRNATLKDSVLQS